MTIYLSKRPMEYPLSQEMVDVGRIRGADFSPARATTDTRVSSNQKTSELCDTVADLWKRARVAFTVLHGFYSDKYFEGLVSMINRDYAHFTGGIEERYSSKRIPEGTILIREAYKYALERMDLRYSQVVRDISRRIRQDKSRTNPKFSVEYRQGFMRLCRRFNRLFDGYGLKGLHWKHQMEEVEQRLRQ